MHLGVVRDIERERRDAADGTPALAACDTGVCDLAATRFREPTTGVVYTPSSLASIPPLR